MKDKILKQNAETLNQEYRAVHNHKAVYDIVRTAMFAAVIAILSQIAIPLPSGVPATLQTFAVALTGAVMAWKPALLSTGTYILLGTVGIPVFSGFKGGLQVLFGPTGGFIWGFLFMAILCSIGSTAKNKLLGIITGAAGLAICHLLGIFQYMSLMKMPFTQTFLLISMPYLLKDFISLILGFILGSQIRSRLIKNALLHE